MVLASLRRRLLITTWMIITTQSLFLAVATAQVCVEREHEHAGVPAPDCAMHHQHGARSEPRDVHPSHTGMPPAGTDIQISCRCSTDVRPPMLGENGLIEGPQAGSPSLQIVMLARPTAGSVPEHVNPPSSPPPR